MQARRHDPVLATAGGATTLWTLAWLGTEALPFNPAIQGGFAAGTVVASSGLALLLWRARTMRAIADAEEDAPPSS